jgi:hypothetical protein
MMTSRRRCVKAGHKGAPDRTVVQCKTILYQNDNIEAISKIMEHKDMIATMEASDVRPLLSDVHNRSPSLTKYRAIRYIIWPTLGFKSICCTRILLAGIEPMHMIRKRQPASPNSRAASATTAFYSLAY